MKRRDRSISDTTVMLDLSLSISQLILRLYLSLLEQFFECLSTRTLPVSQSFRLCLGLRSNQDIFFELLDLHRLQVHCR